MEASPLPFRERGFREHAPALKAAQRGLDFKTYTELSGIQKLPLKTAEIPGKVRQCVRVGGLRLEDDLEFLAQSDSFQLPVFGQIENAGPGLSGDTCGVKTRFLALEKQTSAGPNDFLYVLRGIGNYRLGVKRYLLMDGITRDPHG